MHREKLPGIGLDYDGTIAHTGAIKAAWIRAHLGLTVPAWRTDRTYCVPIIGPEAYERMSRVVYAPEASQAAPMVPGVAEAMQTLSAHYRLYLVTARNLAQMAWSQRWLATHGLAQWLDGYLSSGEPAADGRKLSKAALCRARGITILIDDDVRHLADPAMGDFRRILIKPGCNEPLDLPAGVELATGWQPITSKLVDKERL